jgi:hypothetical protein
MDPSLSARAEARWKRVLTLEQSGKSDEALAELRIFLRQNSKHSRGHAILASFLARRGEEEKAIAEYGVALALDPGYVAARVNRCTLSLDLLRFPETAEDLKILLTQDPGNYSARINLAVFLLLQGEWEQGLACYECRWDHPILREALKYAKAPRWEDQNLQGKTLLLCAEQGLGDTIHFARYAPMAKAMGARVLLQAQDELHDVLRSLQGVDELIPIRREPPPHDFYLPLASAPRLFGTRPHNIPWNGPYLAVPDTIPHRETINARIDSTKGRRIGLVWAGGTRHERNAQRSMDPSFLGPLWQLPGISWFSLQLGQPVLDIPHLVDLSPLLGSFADTAHALSRMDLLVSVDTSVAHLAGALGVPTRLLLTYFPDWRWLLEREDSPWYPGHRLKRQPRPRDWEAVICSLVADLG